MKSKSIYIILILILTFIVIINIFDFDKYIPGISEFYPLIWILFLIFDVIWSSATTLCSNECA